MSIKKSDKPTKIKILNASSKIIAQKGFSGCSLSDIANEAGVREPTIYQHFKGKEDLLFYASEQHMENYLSFLNEHLQGIIGAHNKLRKLIWAHLRYSDIDKEYMTMVLFECRTNRNFYQSGAYKLIRKYTGSLEAILEEGVKEGIFRRDLNIRLVRDIVFGLMDFEAITCLVTHEIPEAVRDHEEIMELLDRMLLSKYHSKILAMEKKQRIFRAAVQTFAEKGYSNATIAEIAHLADISEGTVYEYFKNKEDLLLSIPEKLFQDHLEQLNKTFDINDPKRKLRLFIQHHFQLYLNDPNFLIVFLTQIQFNRRFYESRAYNSLRKYIKVFEELVQEIISDGKSTINIRIFRNMFLGAFTHMTLRWFVFSKDGNIDKMEEINEVTKLLTDIFDSFSPIGGI